MTVTKSFFDSIERTLGTQFIYSIINGMYDWVRVIDTNNSIIYMNKSMSDAVYGLTMGDKCYKALGRTSPCDNCVSRKVIFDGNSHEKEEIINGRIFSVMSSPVRNENNEITAVVEVLRDITQTKKLQDRIIAQSKKLQDDLSIARKLQCSLLPRELPEDKVDFSFIYKPCETIGGDFLDIFQIDEKHIGIYIADVSGHGVPASMLTVFLRSSINKKLLSPASALSELYKDFNSNGFDADLYITVFYAVINLNEKSLVYSNAGHSVSPFVFNTNRFEMLRVPGIPISNWLDVPNYSDKSISLLSEDRLFLYTDGIIELKNEKNEQFGDDRLLSILLNDSSESSSMLNRILNEAYEFANIKNSSTTPDDITMALIKIRQP